MEERIAKLLAMAEGTTNPAEAEAFMAKAEMLMLKFGIDRANVESKGKPQEIIVTKIRIPNGHGYASAMIQISHAVGPSFSLRTLQVNLADGGRVAWLIGHRGDVDDAETLLTSLLVQSRAQALAWWKKEGNGTANDAYLARREFIFAFASGVRDRLAETRNRVVAESSAGTELVLVDRTKKVDSWVDENMKVGRGRATNRRSGSYAASVAGRTAGRDSVGVR